MKIRSVVCLSVLPLAGVVPGGPGHASCFELFGFDVMVDSTLTRQASLSGRIYVTQDFALMCRALRRVGVSSLGYFFYRRSS